VAEVLIAKAGSERLDDVRPLWLSMMEHHVAVAAPIPGIPMRAPEDSWPIRRRRYEDWLSQPDAFLLLAETRDLAVGYAVVSFHPEDDTNVTGPRTAELHSLAVLASHRGTGLGRRLLRAVYREVRALGVEEMMIAVMEGNDRVRDFYGREGFTPWVTMTLGKVPDVAAEPPDA
jgi:ribosomal protein S18 acetylase RimI-like enzyme